MSDPCPDSIFFSVRAVTKRGRPGKDKIAEILLIDPLTIVGSDAPYTASRQIEDDIRADSARPRDVDRGRVPRLLLDSFVLRHMFRNHVLRIDVH